MEIQVKLSTIQQLREWANCVYADDSPELAETMREAATELEQYEALAEARYRRLNYWVEEATF
jgi:hypothetical protein